MPCAQSRVAVASDISSSCSSCRLCFSRASLLEGAGRDRPPQETEATAGLDNRGVVQLQQSLMRQQDSQVEQLEQSVGNTRVRRLRLRLRLQDTKRIGCCYAEQLRVAHSSLLTDDMSAKAG